MTAITTPGEHPSRAGTVISLAVVVVIGLLAGALTLLGQAYLPDILAPVAESYAVWLTASFVVGVLVREERWAWIGGGAVHLFALIGYWASSYGVLGHHTDAYLHTTLFLVIGGILVGPLLGAAGRAWRRRGGWASLAGCSVLSATFVSEGLYMAGSRGIGYAFLVVGVAIALVLPRTWPRRFVCFCAGLALGGVLYGIYAGVFLPLYDHLH